MKNFHLGNNRIYDTLQKKTCVRRLKDLKRVTGSVDVGIGQRFYVVCTIYSKTAPGLHKPEHKPNSPESDTKN